MGRVQRLHLRSLQRVSPLEPCPFPLAWTGFVRGIASPLPDIPDLLAFDEEVLVLENPCRYLDHSSDYAYPPFGLGIHHFR